MVLFSAKRLNQPQGHSAARRIMAMKNSNDTIRNQTRDLPTCSIEPQLTAPPHTHIMIKRKRNSVKSQVFQLLVNFVNIVLDFMSHK